MKLRVISAAIIAGLLANFAVLASTDGRRKGKKKVTQTERIVALLPASDAVAVFDSKRFLDEAMPRVLTANQPMLDQIMGHVSMIQQHTGIDLKKFQRVAVGVSYKEVSAKETDFEPVMVATATDFNFGAMIAAIKLVANGNYRSETVAGKSVFIFTVDPAKVAKTPPAGTSQQKLDMFDKLMKSLSKEIAVSAIDKDTLAVGTFSRVCETLENKSNVDAELTKLIASNKTPVMSFAMRPPGGMAKLLPIDNDEIGKNLETIRILSGSLEVAASTADLHLLARTKTPGDALGLRDLLEVGQSFGKMAFAKKTRPTDQVYRRMIENAKLASNGSDVTLDVSVPQADVDVLVATIKGK